MFARLLALCCLFIPAFSPGWAASPQPATANLAVYLKTQASQNAVSLDSMKRELARLMLAAGYKLEWRAPETSPIDTGSFLAVVELRGACEAPSDFPTADSKPRETAELASTFLSEGRVLPFSWVNCGNVTKLLAPALAEQPGARADFIFGRAVARLIAHEFYHILMQTREHTRSGISKPSLSAGDLSTESFEFDSAVLAKLQLSPAGRAPQASAAAPVDSSTEPPDFISGRSGVNR